MKAFHHGSKSRFLRQRSQLVVGADPAERHTESDEIGAH
jgi:hypothetical protein